LEERCGNTRQIIVAKHTEKEYKSILNVRKAADNWFWNRYGINPYNGCEFNCIYCDSRSSKYHLPEDFENAIYVKKNAALLLDKRLSKARRLKPDIIGVGGTCDPYQQAEKDYKTTQSLLKVILKYRFPVQVVSKSNLIIRDMDLLQKIKEESGYCNVSLSITTTDDELSQKIEPSASLSSERFQCIQTIKQNSSIQCGILFMPALPGISDSNQDMELMVASAKEANADYILFGGLTLRDKQAKRYFREIKTIHGDIPVIYHKIYGFSDKNQTYKGSYTANMEYHAEKNSYFIDLCKKYKMAYRIKRFIPNDFRKTNYKISERFLNNAYFLQMINKPYKDLQYAGFTIQELPKAIEYLTIPEYNLLIEKFTEKAKKLCDKYLSEEKLLFY